MKPQTAFVRSDGAIHLHPETAIDLHLSFGVHPGDAKEDDSLRFRHPLENFALFIFGVLFDKRPHRFRHFGHRLVEFRLSGIPVANRREEAGELRRFGLISLDAFEGLGSFGFHHKSPLEMGFACFRANATPAQVPSLASSWQTLSFFCPGNRRPNGSPRPTSSVAPWRCRGKAAPPVRPSVKTWQGVGHISIWRSRGDRARKQTIMIDFLLVAARHGKKIALTRLDSVGPRTSLGESGI